ncbi:MAG TPA: ornithine cyclodeaminase, partial [Alicycliphilus sp.]|nr:ornithine cyclodeaminase [Alicycliphilus sp.]
MTRLIDLPTLAALVKDMGPARFIVELVNEIRADFLRWNDYDKSVRTACHSPAGVIELMPVADDALYSFKYVNGHPGNPALGLPTVMAFGALAEVATGKPLLLCELTLATALRTAATSALAAQALARPDSRSMALIGNGAQSEFQALALHALLGIDELRLFDIVPAASDRLQRNLAHVPGLHMVRAASVLDAVR